MWLKNIQMVFDCKFKRLLKICLNSRNNLQPVVQKNLHKKTKSVKKLRKNFINKIEKLPL